jgi:hypothetical protein
MTLSQKQLAANRANAKKGGVRTAEGKEIAKYNALRHGLLAKEAVVTVGEGAEDPAEFEALAQDLKSQLQPQGALEAMLVEKITVAYWRLRRAYRYEAGLIRRELDAATDGFYGQTKWDGGKLNRTDEEIDGKIQQENDAIAYWQKDKRELGRMRKAGKPLEDIYDWDENWEGLGDRVEELLPDGFEYTDDGWPRQLREFLNTSANWSDDDIWKALIEDCDSRIERHRRQIPALEAEKEQNREKIEVLKKLGSVPSKHELDRLLRYEGAIERQFYKALNQLERLQRLRAGDDVPAPVEVDDTDEEG